MGSNVLHGPRVRLLLALVLSFATACEAPKPSTAPSPVALPSDAPPAKVVGDLALEACDPSRLMPCEQQAVILIEPVAATGVALTYSTEWADGRIDRPTWNADTLGLGGWALDVLQRYDPDRRILLSGDGSWRFADAADIGNGERAVPTFDGLAYFVFDAAWRHVRTVDSITGGTLLTMAYDSAGRLTAATGAGGGWPVSLTVDRNPDGSLRYLAGPGETRTAAVVDGAGRLAAVGRPDGTILAMQYVEHGLVANWQATGRGTFTYTWDDAGRLTKATDPDGVWRELASQRTDGAATITATDPNGGTATFRHERAGDVLSRTFIDTDGTVTQLDTNADGSTRLVEADGTVTTAGAVAHPRWGLAAPLRTPMVETRPDGTAYRVETTTTMGTGSTAPAGGAWESSSTIDGRRWVDAFDPATRTLTSTDPEGRTSSHMFDAEGRLTARQTPERPPVIYAYDAQGVLASTVTGEGATAATTSYSYANGTVTEVLPDGTTITYLFDAFGRLRRASNADEQVAIDHQTSGAVLQVRTAAHPATSFGYSAAGRETAFLPPAVGDDAWYELTTYTPAGQVSTISSEPGKRVEIVYDKAGRAKSWTFDEGTSTATYDGTSGRLASNVSSDGVTTSFSYDGWVPTGIAWSGPVTGDVRQSVNGLLQATAMAVNGGAAVPFAYDDAGLLASIGELHIERDARTGLPTRSALGDVATTFEFDASARLVATTTTFAGQSVITVRYVRDLMGRVTRIDRTDAGGDTTTSAYGYDASSRLSSYQRGATSTTYAYDAAGNRVGVIRGPSKTAAAFDDRDRLTGQGKESFRHSPDGTLLARAGSNGTTAYEFDDLGALRSVVLPDGRRVEYVIDAGGRRIGRKVDGVLTDGYLYGIDDAIVAWTDGSGRVRAQFAYDAAGRLALVRRDGRDLVVVTDQLGSPIALLDGSTGEVVVTSAYDAWGNVIGDAPWDVLPLGFAGGLVDPATGLIHFGARDYDPAAGRWTAPDPLRYEGGDTNLYRYASGDPVNLIDPTGTSSCQAAACPTSSARSDFKPLPMGGGSRSPSGSTSGGSRPYHDRGPTGGTSGGGGRAKHDVGPSSGGTNDGPLSGGYQRPERAPRGGPEEYRNSNTACLFSACTRRDGNGKETYRGSAPGGQNAICTPAILCGPPIPGENGASKPGYCVGYCSGGDPEGNDGFTCYVYCTYGEPHLVTADGGQVAFQAAGEFVVARSADGAFEVQERYEPSRVVPTVTMTTAVTMRVGADRVASYRDPDTGDQSRALVINGEAIERTQYSTTLAGGGVVERLGADIRVTWPDGTKLGVHLYAKFMNVSLAPADALAATTVGVLGGRDGDRLNDLTTRDGLVLDAASADFLDQLVGPFADSWRTTQVESLFDYRKGETTDTFQQLEVPSAHVTLADLGAGARADAEALCRAMGVTSDPILGDCIFDVGMTGDSSFAGSAATVAVAMERAAVAPVDLGTALARGQVTTGNLLGGVVDRYHFTAAAGEVVYLDAEATCSPGVSWRLLNPRGAIAAFEKTCDDIGRRLLGEAGEWRIEVYSDTAAAGTYGFKVITVAAPREGSIAPGGTASGTTTAVGEWHRYALQATAGQVVYLDAQGGCESPLSWRLLRPGGSLQAFETACTDMGRKVLDVAGPWVIEVYSDDLDTGSYAFRVIGVPAARETATSVGATVTDATDEIGEWHRYRLTATAGQIVYLDALGTCVPGLSWQLLNPEGSLSTFATTCTDMGRRVLDKAGDWVIEIYAHEFATGAYSFKVIGAPAVQAKSILIGQRVADTIDAIGEWHRYRLTATAGQKILIDAQSDCVDDLWWRLLGPNGSLTTFAKTCVDSDARTLDVAGEWTIEIYSDSMATGSYAFTVNTAP